VNSPLTQVKTGTTVTISAYVNFVSIPDTVPVSVLSSVFLNGNLVHRSGLSTSLGRSDTGLLWEHSDFTPTDPGKYTIQVTVLAGGVRQTDSATFTAKQPQTKPSLNFDALRTYDDRGKKASKFRVGHRVVVSAHFNVKNAPSSGVVAQLTEILQTKNRGRWNGLGRPVKNRFDTTNGRHQYQFSFVPQTAYDALRIVIGLDVGGHKSQRSVTVQVDR